MVLREAVEKYLSIAGEFDRPMPLSAFGLGREETESMLSAWEEDYQLHRHLELVPAGTSGPAKHTEYLVGGVAYTEIVIRQSISSVIGQVL
jgi:hypothetical protein